MFKWLENLDTKRWWNMLIITSFILMVLFGSKVITIVDPQAGFLFSLGILLFAIGESANHEKIQTYKKGHISYFDPFTGEEVGRGPLANFPDGYKYIRKPIFIGLVLDFVGLVFFIVGIIKLF